MAPGLQHPRVAENGVQRCAQLVRQGREELILQTVGALKLLIRLRRLDGEGRASGQVVDDPDIVIRQVAA